MKFALCGSMYPDNTASTSTKDITISSTVVQKANDDVVQHNPSSATGSAEELIEDTSDSSDEDYFSAADSEDEQGETDADWEVREKERQRVLEAAGLILNEDVKPPPRLERARSTRKRRPPPAAPRRSSIISNSLVSKDLPPVPDSEPSPADHSTRLDDAFDRYEAFKQQTPTSNRLSIASSFETAHSSLSGSPVVSLAPSTSGLSKDGEGRSYSYLLNFLGRKTPGSDGLEKRTLTISSPIMNNPDSPSRENSPAFGSVSVLNLCILSTDLVVKSWASLVDKSVVQELPKEERRRQEACSYAVHRLLHLTGTLQAIFELICTEADYVRDLQLIVGASTLQCPLNYAT